MFILPVCLITENTDAIIKNGPVRIDTLLKPPTATLSIPTVAKPIDHAQPTPTIMFRVFNNQVNPTIIVRIGAINFLFISNIFLHNLC